MVNKKDKQRKSRKLIRVRKKLFGTHERPRLSVFRSLKHVNVQLIDDTKGITLLAVSTKSSDIIDEVKSADSKVAASKIVGSLAAKKASELGIKSVVFDRGLYRYHGRVKAVAEGAREGGLEF